MLKRWYNDIIAHLAAGGQGVIQTFLKCDKHFKEPQQTIGVVVWLIKSPRIPLVYMVTDVALDRWLSVSCFDIFTCRTIFWNTENICWGWTRLLFSWMLVLICAVRVRRSKDFHCRSVPNAFQCLSHSPIHSFTLLTKWLPLGAVGASFHWSTGGFWMEPSLSTITARGGFFFLTLFVERETRTSSATAWHILLWSVSEVFFLRLFTWALIHVFIL